MDSALSFIRRAHRTKVVLEHTQEMAEEELRLRNMALVLTVAGNRPLLIPGHICDGLLHDFPELPPHSFQVSLMQPNSFFVRFSEEH
jgi:hypothetical protein